MSEESEKCNELTREEELEEIASQELDYGEEKDCSMDEEYDSIVEAGKEEAAKAEEEVEK